MTLPAIVKAIAYTSNLLSTSHTSKMPTRAKTVNNAAKNKKIFLHSGLLSLMIVPAVRPNADIINTTDVINRRSLPITVKYTMKIRLSKRQKQQIGMSILL